MNHVPNEVLAAIDGVGRGLLVEDPTVLRERLRSDFRLRIDCDTSAFADGTAPIAFRLEHASARDALRDHGSYVCTIVDTVDSHLAGWGIEPPPAYAHRATENGWQVYAGTLALRGFGD
jgi:hypothetical protein